MDPIEFSQNGLVEIPHQAYLLEGREVLLHQLSKLGTERHHGAPVATHIGHCDSRDDAAWTNGDVVHVAAGITSPEGPGMDPDPQARHICDARGALVTGPCFRALQAVRVLRQNKTDLVERPVAYRLMTEVYVSAREEIKAFAADGGHMST